MSVLLLLLSSSLFLTASGAAPGSSQNATNTSAEDVELLDLDYMLLANITLQFALPKQAAGWCVGGLVLLTTIDSTIKKGFEDLPEVSMLLYCILLGIFSSMVCEIYWEDDSCEIILEKLGTYHAFCGLFAQSMLLGTPLLLFIPNQEFAERLWENCGCGGSQSAIKSCFQHEGLRRVLLFIYLILVAFQVASCYTFYKLAELQEEALAESQAVNIAKAEESTSPLIMVILYLVLAWCNVITVYEFLFDASFAEDFPGNVFRRTFGCELKEAADGEEDDAEKGYISRAFGAIRDATPAKTLADARTKVVEHGQKLIDIIKGAMPTSYPLQCLHFWLYVIVAMSVLVLIGVLEARMFRIAGASAWSVLFLVLTILLVLFLSNFSLFASCGVKAKINAKIAHTDVNNVIVFDRSKSAKEYEIEVAVLSEFSSVIDHALTSTTEFDRWHWVIVVSKREQESVVAQKLEEIATFVSNKAMERDGGESVFRRSAEVRIMSADEYAAMRTAMEAAQTRRAAFMEWTKLNPAPAPPMPPMPSAPELEPEAGRMTD